MMGKVHTLVVMDMASGIVLYDEWHEYAGPWALCGGGSESTTNTVDYAYNARMATLSEEQQEWAREYFQVWQQWQKPYEIAQAKANLEILPAETGLYERQIDAASDLLPQDKQLAESQFGQAARLIPAETSLTAAHLEEAEKLLPYEVEFYHRQVDSAVAAMPVASGLYRQSLENASGLMPEEAALYRRQIEAVAGTIDLETGIYRERLEKSRGMFERESEIIQEQMDAVLEVLPAEKEYYQHGIEHAERLLPRQSEHGEKYLAAVERGIDVNERMSLAAADAAFAWKDVRAQAVRANARIGVNPASGRFQGIMAALDIQKAAQIAGAVTQARVNGEQENFTRMSQAAAYNGAGVAIQDVLPTKPQVGNHNAANASIQTMQALKPQTGNYTAALQNMQASQSVKPEVRPLEVQANSALANARGITGHAPRGASSEILQGVSAIKG